MGMMLGTALFGASLGAAQALAMRRAHGWRGDWVVASTAAWVIVGLLWLGGWHLARGNVQGDGVLSPFARLYQSGNAELLLLSIGLAGSALLTGPLLPRVVSGQGTATVAMDGERPS
ncbi:MAG TPA: hypothetical protein VJ596_09590, partial [Gemmatimonadaceae bacterium]|nr:hypothetical protein [Gemmatimonadaceae bacterium]